MRATKVSEARCTGRQASDDWSVLIRQFLRYFLVSVVALVVDFGGLVLLVEVAACSYLLAAAVSFLLGLMVNYGLSVTWVFTARAVQNRSHEFTVFGIIGVVGLGINQILLWVMVDSLHMHYILAKTVCAAAVFVWNFCARRMILFR